MLINTTIGAQSIADSFSIRRTALVSGVPYFTTIAGAMAATHAIEAARHGEQTLVATSLQDYHRVPARDPEEPPRRVAGYRQLLVRSSRAGEQSSWQKTNSP